MKTVFKYFFQREFTGGLLKGLTIDDTWGTTFVSNLEADDWIQRVNAANKNGKVNFKVLGVNKVEKVER